MYDLKTVMSWLEGLTEDDWEEWYSHSEVQNTAKVAMELLKEQDDLGAELTNAVELIHKKNERIKELLKEQEAVPVIQREVMHMLVWCCGSCGVAITDGDKFCRNCGKKMKWDA